MQAGAQDYGAYDRVSKLIQDVKNILDKKDVLKVAPNEVRATSLIDLHQNSVQGGAKDSFGRDSALFVAPRPLSQMPLGTEDLKFHKSLDSRVTLGLEESTASRGMQIHLRGFSAGHPTNFQGNPAVSPENSLGHSQHGNWVRQQRKTQSATGIVFRFSGRLIKMRDFLENYDRVKVSEPVPIAILCREFKQYRSQQVKSSSSAQLLMSKLKISNERVVDFSSSSRRQLSKNNRNQTNRTAKDLSHSSTTSLPQISALVPSGQGPKNLTKSSQHYDEEVRDMPNLTDGRLTEVKPLQKPVQQPKQATTSRPSGPLTVEQTQAEPSVSTAARRALTKLGVFTPTGLTSASVSACDTRAFRKVGYTYSFRPNKQWTADQRKDSHEKEAASLRDLPDRSGRDAFKEITVELNMQKMQAYLMEELRRQMMVERAAQTEGVPAPDVHDVVTETEQCNFVPVFGVDIEKPVVEDRDEEDEKERTLTVYAERDWRLKSTNREGLYEALRDQLDRTSERISLEKAKESIKQAKASQQKLEREARQREIARQKNQNPLSEGEHFHAKSPGKLCRHLECIASGLDDENLAKISDSRSSRGHTVPEKSPTSGRLVVNLYGSRLLEDSLSGAKVLTPSHLQQSSEYIRIGDVLPAPSQRQSASTRIAISSLSSSAASHQGSHPRFSRLDHHQDYVIEDSGEEDPHYS